LDVVSEGVSRYPMRVVAKSVVRLKIRKSTPFDNQSWKVPLYCFEDVVELGVGCCGDKDSDIKDNVVVCFAYINLSTRDFSFWRVAVDVGVLSPTRLVHSATSCAPRS